MAEITGSYALYFHHDARGEIVGFTYASGSTQAEYFYRKNLQGDVIGIVDASGNSVAEYAYDAWGQVLSATGTMASINPIRYRGYYFDQETGLYYLQSRYYDPEIGRFINADDAGTLGANGEILSYNLFAYCLNNPVSGYDPTGYWNWGGVLAGLAIAAVGVFAIAVTLASCGAAAPAASALVATTVTSSLALATGAAVTATGATMTYAAATDSAMVMDVSCAVSVNRVPGYVKTGESVIIDFRDDGGIYRYPHNGSGLGKSFGFSYSVGLVDSFKKPEDYSGDFHDVNYVNLIGLDHCYNPKSYYFKATKATSVSFGVGVSYGVGWDYYHGPEIIAKW